MVFNGCLTSPKFPSAQRTDLRRGMAGLDLAIVTGGNRGIGLAIVEGLWKHKKFHTVIACRSVSAGENAEKEIRAMEGGGAISVLQLDLGDFDSVRKFAGDVKALVTRHKLKGIQALYNNAGVLRWQGQVFSKNGFEEHLQANYLGHFLLTRELLPLLLEHKGSRVIHVGSHLADYARIRWDNFNDVEGFEAYKQSKLMQLLHTQHLHSLHTLHTQHLHSLHAASNALYAFCCDPGEVNTSITRHFPFASFIDLVLKYMPERNTPQQGADSALYCGVCDQDTAIQLAGCFIRDREVVDLGTGTGTWFSRMLLSVVMSTSVDMESHGPEAALKLWNMSNDLVDGKVKLAMVSNGGVSFSVSSLVELVLAFLIVILAFCAALYL